MKTFLIFIVSALSVFGQAFDKSFTLINIENSPLASNRVERIIEDNSGAYWIVSYPENENGEVTAGGFLQKFYKGEWTTFDASNSPLDKDIVNDVAESKTGEILVATNKGLFIKNGNNWDSVSVSNSNLPDNFIYRVSIDDDNRFWLGLPEYGIAVYDEGIVSLYNYTNAFEGIEDFNFIKFDSSNNVWIGTDYYGLYKFENNVWKEIIPGEFSDGEIINAVSGFAVDNDNNIWTTVAYSDSGSYAANIVNDSIEAKFYSNDIGFYFDLFSYDGLVIDENNVKYFGSTNGLMILQADGEWTKLEFTADPHPNLWFKNGYVDSKNNKIYALSFNDSAKTNYGLLFYNEDSVVITDVNYEKILPGHFNLSQNFPNPFNPSTIIKYAIPQKGLVQIKVFDILGNEIKTLVNEEKAAGSYEVKFNAVNLSSGVYLYRITSGNFSETNKMVLLR